MVVFFLKVRRPTSFHLTDTLFPYTTCFRSSAACCQVADRTTKASQDSGRRARGENGSPDGAAKGSVSRVSSVHPIRATPRPTTIRDTRSSRSSQIGRAHV